MHLLNTAELRVLEGRAAAILAVMLLLVAVSKSINAISPLGNDYDLDLVLMRGVSLIVIAGMLAYVRAYRESSSTPQFTDIRMII
jgi:hypothetical protein